MPASSGRVAVDELPVLRHQQHRAEHREEDDRDRAAAGAEPRVLEDRQIEHRMRRVQLPGKERRQSSRRRARRLPTTSGSVQPFDGPSMIPNSSDARPTNDSTRAERIDLCRELGSRDVGTRKAPSSSAVAPIGRFTQNTDDHEKCSRRKPPAIGPIATPSPEKPGPDRDRPAAFDRVAEHVDQDRERRGHDQRAADAHERSGEDQPVGRGRHRCCGRPDDRTARCRAAAHPCGRIDRTGCRS